MLSQSKAINMTWLIVIQGVSYKILIAVSWEFPSGPQKDLVLSLLWHGFNPWPRTFCITLMAKKKKKTNRWIFKIIIFQHFGSKICFKFIVSITLHQDLGFL